MRLTLALACVPLAALAVLQANAHATGLEAVVPLGDGDIRVLGRLDALTIDVRLGPAAAEITQRRTYMMTRLYGGGPVTLTFYDSVPEGAAPPAITINGVPATGATRAPADADALRRELTRVLADPAPLRGMGRPLHATDAMAVDVPITNLVDVTITTTVPLAAIGTMRGLIVPLDWGRSPVGKVDVNVAATSGGPLRALYSPYHELQVVRDGVGAAHATYAGRSVCTDFDLTLLVSSGDGLVHMDLLPFRYGAGEGGTFLALVTPDPTPIDGNVLPRDLVFVLDTSGSMAGAKMTQAKEALRGVLQGLRPADSFALVTFSDAVRTFQSGASVAASAENVAAAVGTIDSLVASGGTNIHDALRTGLGALPPDTGRPRYVVFLTDGVPTVGTTGIDAIAAMAQASNAELGARLFSFGIGNDVNTVLLDRLARDSAGDVIYIRPDQSVAVAVQTFWLQLADPVLSDPAVDFGAFAAADLFPDVMSDLFAGRTVSLFGRYGTSGQGTVPLGGMRAGQPWSAAYDVTLPDYALDSGYVPRVWALRQVGRLLAKIKAGDADPQLPAQVLALATRFGITTNFTYFMANAEGDVSLRYAGVSTAQTGSVAVDTSTALRDYGSGTSVPATSTPTLPVRYAADRTFAAQGGYLTDTKLAGPEVDVDLTFGSDRYFAFAAAEAAYGAGALLAAGNNIRFELLGRAFRITDPAALPRSVTEPPPESPAIPDPVWRPVASAVTSVVGTNAPGGNMPPTPVTDDRQTGLAGRAGCACDTGSGGRGGAAPLFGLAIVLGALAGRARRRHARALPAALVKHLGAFENQP
jgi:Ca-activated chloride channel family protein